MQQVLHLFVYSFYLSFSFHMMMLIACTTAIEVMPRAAAPRLCLRRIRGRLAFSAADGRLAASCHEPMRLHVRAMMII